jgi:pentatricopeptide repeat protein
MLILISATSQAELGEMEQIYKEMRQQVAIMLLMNLIASQ